MNDIFDTISTQADALRTCVTTATNQLQDFARRLELILSQEHRKLPIRDEAFGTDFATFCTELRTQTDQQVETWQQTRQQVREQMRARQTPTSLQVKGFALRAKTLSRACDEFTTAYTYFNKFYKNYTLAKLPVWILTACCDDLNNITGKILFLSREIGQKQHTSGESYAAR